MLSRRWVVTCRNCDKVFKHSGIVETGHAIDYFFPVKPEFSAGGEELECPHCYSKAVYYRTDLRFELCRSSAEERR